MHGIYQTSLLNLWMGVRQQSKMISPIVAIDNILGDLPN